MKTINICYLFRLPDNREEIIDVHLDPQSLDLLNDITENMPHWTALDFHQCPNCTLTVEKSPRCPAAAHLVQVIETFSDLLSYDRVRVEITTRQRVVSQETNAQKGVSSLMGLIMATSGCPRTAFLKPMARFHLPLADSQETVYRATSMYLLAQYFLKKEGGEAELDLEGLKRIYSDIQSVNEAMSHRLRAAGEKDVAVNSLVILDVFAQAVPFVIAESLEEIRHLFDPYFERE